MPKQKKPCLEWQPHKAELQNLYLVQDLSLERLMRHMEETHGFRATKAQYESQLKKWNIRKNLTNEEWNYTLLRVRKRKFDGKESDVYLNGRVIPEKRVKKEMSRHFTLTQEQLFDTVSIPSTPEAIIVSTPNATFPTVAANIDVLQNLPYFRFQALLESAALPPMVSAQGPLVGTARQIALGSPNGNLQSFTSRDFHEGDMTAPLHRIASLFRPTSNEDGQMLLAGLFGSRINANGKGFLPQIRSQMLVSSLERYGGEHLEKIQLLCSSLRQSSVLQILELALYRLSNNLLSEYETDGFLRWLIKQQQNGLLASFLTTQIPTVHACATKILGSVLRVGDANFLELLIDSGIDISPLKGVCGGRHLLEAAYQGNTQIVQILLKNGADVNILSRGHIFLDVSTALECATMMGHVDMVQVLLRAGANLDAVSVSGLTTGNIALSRAVCRENVELVHILLTAGANIDSCRIRDKSAIKYSALFINNEELHQTLLSASSKDYSSITCHGVLKAASTDTQALSKYLTEIGKPGDLVQAVLQRALECACYESNHSAIISLLDIGEDPNRLLSYNLGKPFRAAVSRGDFELIKILLRAGADVNTPRILISAIDYDKVMSHGTQMLQLMLDAGANIIETHGEEALRYAAHKGYFEAAQLLVLSGVDVNAEAYDGYLNNLSVLHCAVLGENIRLVKSLLHTGADVNAISYYCNSGQDETALNVAVWNLTDSGPYRLEMVQALLAAGADVNIPEENRTGPSILESAICDGDEELISILLKEGADVNSPPKGEYGKSPIQLAVTMENLPLIELLLESGADINAPAGYHYGRTAIQAASSADFPTMELIEFLLDAGAEINAPAGLYYGRTAIQAASSADFPTMALIEFLLDAGADINAPAGFHGGVTALQGAAIRGHMGIALKYLEAGADVNAAAAIIDGRTALDGAAEHGRLDMVQMLLNAGAAGDSTKSHRFDRAIELARKYGHFAVASLLERA